MLDVSNMIIVTSGTKQYPFKRLMTWIEALISRGFIQEEVVVQSSSPLPGSPAIRSFESTATDCLVQLSGEASLIVSDCDAERLELLDQTEKPYILVPRTLSYNEYIDDRQMSLGAALAQIGIPVAWSPGDLVRFISSPQRISLASEVFDNAVCQYRSES